MFNVTIQCPITNRPNRHLMVGADRVNLKERTFHYNQHYPNCPILEIEEVSPAKVESVASWCEKHGTE